MRVMSTAARRLRCPVAGLALIAPARDREGHRRARVCEALGATALARDRSRLWQEARSPFGPSHAARSGQRDRVSWFGCKLKYASGGRVLVAERLARLAGAQSPLQGRGRASELARRGPYWLSTCEPARAGSNCRLGGGRLTVVAPSPVGGRGAWARTSCRGWPAAAVRRARVHRGGRGDPLVDVGRHRRAAGYRRAQPLPRDGGRQLVRRVTEANLKRFRAVGSSTPPATCSLTPSRRHSRTTSRTRRVPRHPLGDRDRDRLAVHD